MEGKRGIYIISFLYFIQKKGMGRLRYRKCLNFDGVKPERGRPGGALTSYHSNVGKRDLGRGLLGRDNLASGLQHNGPPEGLRRACRIILLHRRPMGLGKLEITP